MTKFAALNSFVLASALPFSEKPETGYSELMRGLGSTVVSAPCIGCIFFFRFGRGGSEHCGSSRVVG